MIRCCITDRRLERVAILLETGGADWVQIRDKELPARELLDLVRRVMALPNPHSVRILVNSRVDVAIAAGADGAHLPAGSIAPETWRPIVPAGFLIGVSCHTMEETIQAEREGADFVFFGPVFAPLSKSSDLAPRGLDELGRVARAVKIPVLALGGITEDNRQKCVEAGAAGVAGITLFRHAS
jgi:thiamine-phosphate pyrophosphorylase